MITSLHGPLCLAPSFLFHSGSLHARMPRRIRGHPGCAHHINCLIQSSYCNLKSSLPPAERCLLLGAVEGDNTLPDYERLEGNVTAETANFSASSLLDPGSAGIKVSGHTGCRQTGPCPWTTTKLAVSPFLQRP
jgi:hypothetical protein